MRGRGHRLDAARGDRLQLLQAIAQSGRQARPVLLLLVGDLLHCSADGFHWVRTKEKKEVGQLTPRRAGERCCRLSLWFLRGWDPLIKFSQLHTAKSSVFVAQSSPAPRRGEPASCRAGSPQRSPTLSPPRDEIRSPRTRAWLRYRPPCPHLRCSVHAERAVGQNSRPPGLSTAGGNW